MKKLPLGIQTFSEMIEEQYLYVDKTRQILDLVHAGKYVFLARPRRFGKSLLVSTFKELFSGHQSLFKGLWIYDKIDWQTYPVVHLDLSRVSCDNETVLKKALISLLDAIARDFGVTLTEEFVKERFFELIKSLYLLTSKKVVVLVDEYDKPIINFIETPEQAARNRNVLKEFYGVLKGCDEYLHFVFLTGVSKFSQVSIFSDLNNLNDITLASPHATLLGYTQEELERDFSKYLTHIAREKGVSLEELLQKIRWWYNGYSWNVHDLIYNPVSILYLLAKGMFRNYWFSTGTPTFLVNVLKQHNIEVSELEGKQVSDILLNSYDIDRIDVAVLLFQTGYLSIRNICENDYGVQYTLDYPNHEVKEAFLTYLFEEFTVRNKRDTQIAAHQLRGCLQHHDLEGFITTMRSLFAGIPYTLHLQQEAYYHSLFYMIAVLMGLELRLEVLTDKGRIDGVLEFEDRIYVIEFKYGKTGTEMQTLLEKAIRQIREKQYADAFRADSRPCFLLGIGFVEKQIGYTIEPAF